MKLTTANLKNSGFTLIELLVVIGVLGILAAGLLAAIDPLEQLRKGNDANKKSAAVELVKALQRYYTSHNAFPWDTAAAGGAACNGAVAPTSGTTVSSAGFVTCFTTTTGAGGLEVNGEVKATYKTSGAVTDTGTDILKIYQTTGTDRRPVSCFIPESRSVKTSAETTYDATGATLTTGCGATSTTCHWCAQ